MVVGEGHAVPEFVDGPAGVGGVEAGEGEGFVAPVLLDLEDGFGGVGPEAVDGEPIHVGGEAEPVDMIGAHSVVGGIDGDFLVLGPGKTADDQDGLLLVIDSLGLEGLENFPANLAARLVSIRTVVVRVASNLMEFEHSVLPFEAQFDFPVSQAFHLGSVKILDVVHDAIPTLGMILERLTVLWVKVNDAQFLAPVLFLLPPPRKHGFKDMLGLFGLGLHGRPVEGSFFLCRVGRIDSTENESKGAI